LFGAAVGTGTKIVGLGLGAGTDGSAVGMTVGGTDGPGVGEN
jgi:hypothetical protein